MRIITPSDGSSTLPAYWMRSENETGPPLDAESISFLASIIIFNAGECPLFSGLLISGF